MNLISCGSCGVVLDKDRIYEPYNYKSTADGCGEEIDEKMQHGMGKAGPLLLFVLFVAAGFTTILGTQFTKNYLLLNNY